MKKINKYFIQYFQVFLVLLAALFFGCGCATSKPPPEVLAGWKIAFKHEPDQTIEKDYHDYIQNLPHKKGQFVGTIHFLEDGTGRHAINIEIGAGGTWWEHFLIYDAGDKRIKVIIYKNGEYRS